MTTLFGDATFESGTLGATLTTSNSPFTDFVQSGWTYVNTPLLASGGGSRAARCVSTSGTASAAAQFPITSSGITYLRAYVNISTRPTANAAIIQALGGTTVRAELQITPTGQFRIRNAAFTTLATSPTDSAPLGGWCRIEWRYDDVAHRQQLRVYSGANLHTETPTWDSTALTIPATGTVTAFMLGSIANSTIMTSVWDNIKVDDTTWVGSSVVVADPAPAANAGLDIDADPNDTATVVLDGTASTGTITSSQWDDMTSGTAVPVAGTGLTRTITLPKNTAASTRTYRLTVSGTGGTTTDTVTVNVAAYRHWRMDGTTLTPRKRQVPVDTVAPTVPGTPVASAGVGSATVTTSGSIDDYGVVAYEWQRNGTVVATTGTTTLIETGLPASPVSYRVRARDASFNWSGLSNVSNTVTPRTTTSVQTMYGACPDAGGITGVISKYGSGASIRCFDGGKSFSWIPTRPATCSRMHASWKPPLGSTITDSQIIAAFANLLDGDLVEVWHEADVKYRNGSALQPMLDMKNAFHASVVRLRNANQIPDVLTVNTWAGWSVDSTSSINPSNLHCDADLLGIDMDGMSASSSFYPYATRQMGTKFQTAYASGGYIGWTVPEFCMPSVSSDPTNSARIAWFQSETAAVDNGVPSANIPPPRMIAWFDTAGAIGPAERLTATNEIAAWSALVAQNT